jgi:hypothetical protein
MTNEKPQMENEKWKIGSGFPFVKRRGIDERSEK